MADKNVVFVFGSNLAGKHGAGSAAHAVVEYGAEYGVGVGMTGRAYAIPTKDHRIKTMPLEEIKPYVREFIQFASDNSDIEFRVVAIGCGLAGYTPEDIAPMFAGATSNVILPPEFVDVLFEGGTLANLG